MAKTADGTDLDFIVTKEYGDKSYTFERMNGTWAWYQGDGDLAHGPVSKDFTTIEAAYADFRKKVRS